MFEKLTPFSLNEITILGDYEQNAYQKNTNYLLSLDENRLLAGFYENAGMKTPFLSYTGWEDKLIAGHTLGHYLTALSCCYQNALTLGETKEKIGKKIENILNGLRECQLSSRGKKGFLWGAKVVDPKNVEKQFDNVEKNRTNIVEQAWVPWYTMHKIIAGLVSVCNYTPFMQARVILSDLCDWVYHRVKKWNEKTRQTVLSIEYGGMNDCLYDAYRITNREEHLFAAHAFDEEELFEKVLSGEKDALNDLHANTTIPKFLGAMKRYLTVGDEKYLRYSQAFFEMVTSRHAYVTGDVSEWEHFGKDFILDGERTKYNCETCAAYNLLILAKNLFLVTKEKRYADYIERTYLNTILAAQNPETGMATYFQPMASGFFKVFSTPTSSFWCCTGTGMEDFAKLGESYFFKDENGVYVNEFRSAKVFWAEKNLSITLRADLEKSDDVLISFETTKEVPVNLYLRVPDWVKGEPTLCVNGESLKLQTENGYVSLCVRATNQTEIRYSLPRKIILSSLPDNENAYAFSFGPFVLSARLGQENMDIGTTGVDVNVPKRAILFGKSLYFNNVSQEDFLTSPEKYFIQEKNSTELSFRLTGFDRELQFIPYYREYTHRYGIYWYLKPFSEKCEEEEEREILDVVQPGYGQYENDALHAMKEKNSVGVTSKGTFRYAKPNGYFTYRMKVELERDNYLIFYLTKEDNGKSLAVSIGEDVVSQEVLNLEGENETVERKILLPKEIVERNKKQVNAVGEVCFIVPITFRSLNEFDSAKVCDFIYIVH